MSTVSPKPVSDAEGPACPCHADKSRVQASEAAAGLSAGTTSGVMPPHAAQMHALALLAEPCYVRLWLQ